MNIATFITVTIVGALVFLVTAVEWLRDTARKARQPAPVRARTVTHQTTTYYRKRPTSR